MEIVNRLRFTIEDDIIVLQEVVNQNSFKHRQNWKLVHENVVRRTKKNYSIRSVREHVVYLLKLYTNGSNEKRR